MSVKACIFDLDGTLLDTLEDLANSCNAALRAVGLPERSLDEVRAFVGNGVRKLMTRAVPPASDQATIDAAFRRHTGRRPTELRRVACPCAE